jgi:transcription initiation factor TFIID subunit 12
MLSVADDFVDDVIESACRICKLRGGTVLDIRDVQLEKSYNIRVPGFSSDEVRTVRRPGGTVAWQQKVLAVQAAKLTGGTETTTATAGASGAAAAANSSAGAAGAK